MSYPTLTERRDAKVAAMRQAVEDLAVALAHYGRANGGRFTIFGSAARGELRYDSDVDILVEFPAAIETEAWLFAEQTAFGLGLVPDIHTKGLSGDKLLARIAAEGRPLP